MPHTRRLPDCLDSNKKLKKKSKSFIRCRTTKDGQRVLITYDIFRTFEEEQVWLVKKKG